MVRLEDILVLIGEEDLKTSGEADFVEFGNLLPDRRTSLIIDSANGKIPPLLPDARRRLEASKARTKHHPADGPEDFNASERCLIAENQASPPMLPKPYNAHIQIVQTPEYVVILTEMIHDARIIPLDGRPHLSPATRQWKGDSRGRWEGDTLVVDTTHFAAKGTYSRFDRLNPSDEALHVIERFKWLSEDTLSYQFTVDDPTVYTKAWTAELPLSRTNEQMFEFACHEGNYSLRNSLSSARAWER